MLKCEDCKVILDSNVRFCPKCGKQVAPDSDSGSSTPQNVSTLLASANLHRMRQEWDAAIADATNALKLEPKNPDIASVLGEIYEQKGMLDDAIMWYQMALEINPSSAADKSSLERLAKRKKSGAGKDADAFQAFQQRVKIGALIMISVFVLIIVLAVVVTRNRVKDSYSGSAPISGRNYNSPLPYGSNTNPSITMPRSGRASSSVPLAGKSAASLSGLRTAGEEKVKSDILSGQIGSASVDDVTADPRQGIVTITFSVPAASSTRGSILTAAGAVARAAFASSAEIKFVTARCVITSGEATSAQIAFVGDIEKSSASSLGATPTSDALLQAFTDQWWNPQIK